MERQAEGRGKIYTETDCEAPGRDASLAGKVVVLSVDACARGMGHQLAFCMGGDGAGPDSVGKSVILVDLRDGERMRRDRSDIIGALKPELLPDREKLQLSQIRPIGAVSLEKQEPRYSGYCFLKDGRYAAGVWLHTEKEAIDYVKMQKPYQHRIMVCDKDDFCVMEVEEAKLVYPDEGTLRRMGEEQRPGGIDFT